MVLHLKRESWWSIRYRESVEASIDYYNALNQIQPVWTRPLDQEEINQIFGGNPDYIKNIGRNIDGKEWTLLNANN